MLSPADAEAKLLSSISTPQDVLQLTREGVTSEAFIVYGEVFEHYQWYAREFGSVPSSSDVAIQFNHLGLELTEPGEVLYYAREVLDSWLARQVYAAVTSRFGVNAVKLLDNPREVVRLLCDDLRQLIPSTAQHVAYLDRDALSRLEWLKERANLESESKVMGIPTGLACFDSRMQGWEAGETVMVMAPKGVGKSWLLMYFGVVAYHHGYRILLLSPEMSWEECALRFDVLYSHLVGVKLSHEALSMGKEDQEVYEDWLKSLTYRDRFIAIDSPGAGGFTVNNIMALVDQYRPDLVLFDGIQLVGSETSQQQWERIKQAADSLKAMAQYLHCTVIWTSQVDREAMRNPTEPASTGASAAYGKAAVEAANRLITLARYEDDDRRRTFKIPNNRSGMEFHNRQHLQFDVDAGVIKQLVEEAHLADDAEAAF